MLDLSPQLDEFFASVAAGHIEVYNEASLQHEFGIWLRNALPSEYRVQFERPASFFGLPRALRKSEIDIAVFLPNGSERYAVELKYPRNGQVPEQMFAVCCDLRFLEELTDHGFDGGWAVLFVDDRAFYAGGIPKPIYAPFRAGQTIRGRIVKPTGKCDDCVDLRGMYPPVWRDAGASRYMRIEVRADTRPLTAPAPQA